jgi:hypothetical protein
MMNKPSTILCFAFFLALTQSCQVSTSEKHQTLYEKKVAVDPPVTYEGEYLTGLDFPVGALGGSVIRMNGKAERAWWQIFNNFESRIETCTYLKLIRQIP